MDVHLSSFSLSRASQLQLNGDSKGEQPIETLHLEAIWKATKIRKYPIKRFLFFKIYC